MTNQRAFVRLLLDSQFEEDGLKDLAKYLGQENERINELITTSQPVAAGATQIDNSYREEKKVLAMEENILYSLVNYLQKIGLLDTKNKVLAQ